MRVWLGRLVIAAVVLALAVAAMPLATILPLVRDDMALDGVVVAVALDWRDFGLETAQERLQYELDHQGIGAQVGDADCGLAVVEDGRFRQVRCAWSVAVVLPGLAEPYPLHFESVARVDPNGTLER